MQPPSRKQSSTSTRIMWRAFVEIENEDGTTNRQGVIAQHTVIGRSPNLPIMLDHDTVSRRHAELFCDPFGRWWLRDLQSTNGTSVNGERIVERVLQPGDLLGIGDMRMRFRLGLTEALRDQPPPTRLPESTDIPASSSQASWVKSLSEVVSPQISAAHLSMIMELSRKLLNQADGVARLAALCELMISEGFHGVTCMALRVRPGLPTEILAGPLRPAHIVEDEPYISHRVLAQVAQTGEPAVGSNLPEHGASLELTISADVVPLAAAASPLGRDGDAMNVLYVNLPPQYGRAEWLALISLCAEAYQQAEAAWTARSHAQEHAAIERELETARQIQRALIPSNLVFEGLEVAIGFEPCKWVGGDYVGAVTATDGRVIVAVADVCGKGLQPALITFSVHTMLSALSDTGRSIPEIMERLNVHLCEYMPEDSFVTIVCISIDPHTGIIECVNAGHPPPLVFSADGSVRSLQSAMNPALGVARCEMRAERTEIGKGDLLLLYTDGLTELRDPGRVMLGEEQLATNVGAIYKSSARAPVAVVAEEVTTMLDAYRGGELPEDDRAFLLARRF